MRGLRGWGRAGADRWRRAGLLAVAVAVETLGRLLLAGRHPALGLVVPPVVAVPVFARLAGGGTAVSSGVNVANAETGGASRVGFRRGLVLAVAGHPPALVGGTALFLLIDTPIRAVFYAAGVRVPTVVVLLLPFLELALATLAAWGVAAPVVARSGQSLSVGVREGVLAVVHAPWRAATRGLRAVGVGVAATVGGVVGVAVGRVVVGDPLAVGVALATVGAVAATLVGVPTLWRVADPAGSVGRPDESVRSEQSAGRANGESPGGRQDGESSIGPWDGESSIGPRDSESSIGPWDGERGGSGVGTNGLPGGRTQVARLVLVVAVIVVATVGAGAVRVTETRPTPAAAPLPGDATEAYAAAVANTRTRNHRFTYRSTNPPGERVGQFAVTRTFDRSDRQYRLTSEGAIPARPAYADAGTGYPTTGTFRPLAFGDREVEAATGDRTVTALPAFWTYAARYRLDGGALALPASGTGEWRRVRADPDRTTLTLTGPRAVFTALFGRPPAAVTAERARIRIHVDPARRVVLGGRATFDGHVGERRVVFSATYEIETGPSVDARRPDSVGRRTAGEWLWKLLAY